MPLKSDTPAKPNNDYNKSSLNEVIKCLNKMQNSLLDINNSLRLHDSKFETLLTKIDDLSSDILKLKDENVSLKNEIGSLHKRIEVFESKSNNTLSDVPFDLLRESEDRKTRANNILIFNLPENKDESIDSITSKTEELFSALHLPITPVKISRIGKIKINSKPRPLKIELNNSAEVHRVLKSKIQLRKIDAWKSIGISTDMTAYQRSLVAQLKSTIAARSNTGDNRWFLMYKNGTPYLGSKN